MTRRIRRDLMHLISHQRIFVFVRDRVRLETRNSVVLSIGVVDGDLHFQTHALAKLANTSFSDFTFSYGPGAGKLFSLLSHFTSAHSLLVL